MSDKREQRQAEGLRTAETVDESVGMTLEEMVRENYGLPADDGLMTAGSDRVNVKLVYATQIVPDWTQPRRVVPNLVRARANWNGSAAGTLDLLNTWVACFAEEVGLDLHTAQIIVNRLVEGKQLNEDADYQDDSQVERQAGTVGGPLLAVIELAASIRRDGLINPITVYQHSGGYRIETGERRWLAFHLLHHVTGEAKWDKIPARLVDAPSVWKQAVENNARMELTAIGKARQLAILVMDLYRQAGHEFQPYEAFDHDRHFYAQVADGNVAFRIPPGKGEEIMQAMGLKSPSHLNKYRALLRISDEMWSQADDEGWAEGFIREQARRLRHEFTDGELRQLSKLAVVDDDTSTIVEVSDEDVPEESLRGFQVGDWISADLGDHTLIGQVTGIEDEKLVVMTEKGTARIDPLRVKGITLLVEPPEQKSYIHSEPASAPPTADNAPVVRWVETYKRNKKSTSNLVAVLLLDDKAILLREDAKEAAQFLHQTAYQKHYHLTNTEYGMALFLMDKFIQDKLNQQKTVVVYTEPDDYENLRAFWHRHVVVNRQESASAPPSSPKQHPNPNTHDMYMHRIYTEWREQFPKDTLVLVVYDGAYLALSHDDSLIRSGEWRGLNAGSIGLSGSADQMLVTKIDLPFVRHLHKQTSVMVVPFDDLSEDMQFVAGKAGRAHSIPLNRLADFQQPDEAAERAKTEREAREEASRALLMEWQETLKQWEAQAKDFKARAAALRLKEAGQAATETQRFSSFLSGFKAWLERKQ